MDDEPCKINYATVVGTKKRKFRKPVLVVTLRSQTVEAGTVLLVGTNKDLIVKEALDLLNNAQRFETMSRLHNPYGDGKACERIVIFISNLQVVNV
jgi:UDP-N-acetylglucosamine 2-epimerase (non-hydrolysing)